MAITIVKALRPFVDFLEKYDVRTGIVNDLKIISWLCGKGWGYLMGYSDNHEHDRITVATFNDELRTLEKDLKDFLTGSVGNTPPLYKLNSQVKIIEAIVQSSLNNSPISLLPLWPRFASAELVILHASAQGISDGTFAFEDNDTLESRASLILGLTKSFYISCHDQMYQDSMNRIREVQGSVADQGVKLFDSGTGLELTTWITDNYELEEIKLAYYGLFVEVEWQLLNKTLILDLTECVEAGVADFLPQQPQGQPSRNRRSSQSRGMDCPSRKNRGRYGSSARSAPAVSRQRQVIPDETVTLDVQANIQTLQDHADVIPESTLQLITSGGSTPDQPQWSQNAEALSTLFGLGSAIFTVASAAFSFLAAPLTAVAGVFSGLSIFASISSQYGNDVQDQIQDAIQKNNIRQALLSYRSQMISILDCLYSTFYGDRWADLVYNYRDQFATLSPESDAYRALVTKLNSYDEALDQATTLTREMCYNLYNNKSLPVANVTFRLFVHSFCLYTNLLAGQVNIRGWSGYKTILGKQKEYTVPLSNLGSFLNLALNLLMSAVDRVFLDRKQDFRLKDTIGSILWYDDWLDTYVYDDRREVAVTDDFDRYDFHSTGSPPTWNERNKEYKYHSGFKSLKDYVAIRAGLRAVTKSFRNWGDNPVIDIVQLNQIYVEAKEAGVWKTPPELPIERYNRYFREKANIMIRKWQHASDVLKDFFDSSHFFWQSGTNQWPSYDKDLYDTESTNLNLEKELEFLHDPNINWYYDPTSDRDPLRTELFTQFYISREPR